MVYTSAPGKIILFGEHAAVYGRPALAVPVFAVRAEASTQPLPAGSGTRLVLHDINRTVTLADCSEEPLASALLTLLHHLKLDYEPDVAITLVSAIPLARGLGSGAAAASAITQALAAYLGYPLDRPTLNELVYQTERLFHGTPSGVDNTVICLQQPVWFRRGTPPETLRVPVPFSIVIGDTGIAASTRETVAAVRAQWEQDQLAAEMIIENMASVAESARVAIEEGHPAELGPLMNQNHVLLRSLSVSSPELDALVEAATTAGATGAKLSGGGGGGCMIALADKDALESVTSALAHAGATKVIITQVTEGGPG